MRSSASIDGADRPRVGQTCGALTTDFNPDRAVNHIELPNIDSNAVYPRVLQQDRGDLFRERLNKIDMAAPDDEADRVQDHVVGENRTHIVRVRAGAAHQSLNIEDDALTEGAFEIVSADFS